MNKGILVEIIQEVGISTIEKWKHKAKVSYGKLKPENRKSYCGHETYIFLHGFANYLHLKENSRTVGEVG